MSWLKKEDVSRSHAVADVLKCIRLPLLAPQYLTDKVAKESLIRNSLPCRFTALFVVKCVFRNDLLIWGYIVSDNKYEKYYWTRKAPTCLLTLLCYYGKPHLCINIHHYAPPVGCSVTHRAATSLAAACR